MVHHPSMRCFDHMFEELRVRNVVTFVPASLKTDSVRSHIKLFQPLLLRVDQCLEAFS